MSVETWIVNSDFSFSDIGKAFKAIKTYSFNHNHENIQPIENIYTAFELWSLSLNQADSNNFTIHSTGDCPGDEGELFHAIAPYITKGGFIKLGVGEGEIVTYSFDGKKCKEKSSLVGIDGFFHLVFIHSNKIELSDCIKKLDESFNCITTKDNKGCSVLFNDELCANILISNHGQKLFNKFQYEQAQVIEAKIADGDIPRIEKLLKDTKCIVLVKFSKSISSADFMDDYIIDREALNNAKKEAGIYWKSYLGLCEEKGIYCIPQEGYFSLNCVEPILNLDY